MTDELTVETERVGRIARFLRARKERDESGLALVWTAVFMIVIVAVVGLAIDMGRGYFVAQKAQNAADAAALAGTIYLPADVTTAYSAAQSVASSNGFTNGGSNSTTVTTLQQTTISQLKVTVQTKVNTWFAKAIGFKTLTIKKSATADYRPPVDMGSPSAQYGNDPESSGVAGSSTTYPNFWGNISGPDTPKGNGDAYQAGDCDSSDTCTAAPADTSCGYTGTNSDYSCDGYYYTVQVSTATTQLKLQAFDPAMVAVGDSCGSNDDSSNLTGAAALTSTKVKGWPSGVTFNASTRYKYVTTASDPTDAGQRYCTGDHTFDNGASHITTTYTVYGPASVPNDPTSVPATPICRKSYPAWFGDLAAGLQSTTKQAVTVNGAASTEYLAQYFRQWDTICSSTINAKANSYYFINVRTNLTTNGQANTEGDGSNRFALRACSNTTCPTGNASIYGNGNMGVYANVGGGVSTSFYLARLLPGDAGLTLSVDLFDIGDASSTGTLTIVPPPDGKNGTKTLTLSGCTIQVGSGHSFVATNGSTGCQETGVNSGDYNGKWVEIDVPIPGGYTCTTTVATNCWFKINYQFSGSIDDSTSWTASLGGDPVRIVL
jgi:Flp pilus assembly protein TadG